MPGIRLEFAQFGDFDSFDVIRSTTSMDDIENLPAALVTGLSTMYYVDADIVKNQKYYYRVAVWRDGVRSVSEQITAWATENVIVIWSDFTTNLIDDTGKTWTSINGASIDEGALKLNRNSQQRLEIPYSPDFHFTNSEDVMIHCKVKISNFSSDKRVLLTTRKDQGNVNNWCIYLEPNSIHFFIWSGSGSTVVDKIWSSVYAFNSEFDLVLKRESMVWKLIIDGVEVGSSVTQSANYVANTNSKLTIGSEFNTDTSADYSRDLDGTIRYLHILKN
ncbi:hypothetical protein MMO39_04865 [Acinetobacter modestus]|uniref:hypothetical protein n=1 Tax=Acinetobacter modestus TaxID=1776740 RepID=UPI001F4B415E|nr:hypothetical protein [Acinetobacter modestus]MCH7386633.1 hypothetical protein [Acinetobacter modestus]